MRRLFAAVSAFAALQAGPALAAGVPTEAAPASAAPVYLSGFRTDDLAFSLSPARDADGSELEYLVRMTPGQTLVYAWSVDGELGDDDFFTDFHGHTPAGPGFRVMAYRQTLGGQGQGALTAPFEGTHGWFFQNRSLRPVKITLKLAGFYDLRPLRETVLEEGAEEIPFGPPRPVQ